MVLLSLLLAQMRTVRVHCYAHILLIFAALFILVGLLLYSRLVRSRAGIPRNRNLPARYLLGNSCSHFKYYRCWNNFYYLRRSSAQLFFTILLRRRTGRRGRKAARC